MVKERLQPTYPRPPREAQQAMRLANAPPYHALSGRAPREAPRPLLE